jgi:hypothetical protein
LTSHLHPVTRSRTHEAVPPLLHTSSLRGAYLRAENLYLLFYPVFIQRKWGSAPVFILSSPKFCNHFIVSICVGCVHSHSCMSTGVHALAVLPLAAKLHTEVSLGKKQVRDHLWALVNAARKFRALFKAGRGIFLWHKRHPPWEPPKFLLYPTTEISFVVSPLMQPVYYGARGGGHPKFLF